LDETFIVPPGQQAEALLMLPIRALRLADDVAQTLKELGVERIDQLLALPRESLPGRLGTHVLQQWDRAVGERDELIEPVRPCEPIILNEDFEHPTHDRGQLTQVLQSLIQRLTGMLAERNEGLQRLDVRFLLDNHTEQDVSLGMLRPAASAEHVMDLLCLRLERLKLDANVAGLRLHAVTIGLLETHQHQLFECEDDVQSRRELARLIDRLSSRLGAGRVVHPRLHDDAQPELALRWESAAANGSTSPPVVVRYRPLRLYSKPLRIEVMSVVPEGPPIRFRWERELHTVARYWGPERIETGWWREDFIRRDYYRVETQSGQRFWLFRRREEEDWYLQGEFG
jgi:protein ImuB